MQRTNEALLKLRRELHRSPSLPGAEKETARIVARFFSWLRPDGTIEGLGGAGLAFVFDGEAAGPTVMLRCELDAVPAGAGAAHLCGHDGHMTIMAGVGLALSRNRPARGRALLLYQPAEETGEGAGNVIEDPRFARIAPDHVFALHNLPGFPAGSIVIREGTFAMASRGMAVRLSGRTAHAAEPEKGISPARAMCGLVESLEKLPGRICSGDPAAMVTVVGACLGGRSFGTAPGEGEVFATLRCSSDEGMERLSGGAEDIARRESEAGGLAHSVEYEDVFMATVNSPGAVDIVMKASGEAQVIDPGGPFPWSEDFGRLTAICDGAMFGLGAGEDAPPLHSPGYEFPDALIEPGVSIFESILEEILS